MTQDLLSLAISRRADIDKEINRLRIEADELDAFIEMHNKMMARFSASLPPVASRPAIPYQAPDSDGNATATKVIPTPKSEIAGAAVRLIRERGHPIPLADLFDALIAAGIVIGGADPKANLSAKLGQSDELISLRGLGWWIKNRPYRGYIGSLENLSFIEDIQDNEGNNIITNKSIEDLLE